MVAAAATTTTDAAPADEGEVLERAVVVAAPRTVAVARKTREQALAEALARLSLAREEKEDEEEGFVVVGGAGGGAGGETDAVVAMLQ